MDIALFLKAHREAFKKNGHNFALKMYDLYMDCNTPGSEEATGPCRKIGKEAEHKIWTTAGRNKKWAYFRPKDV